MEWQLIFLIVISGLLFLLMTGLPVFAAFLIVDMFGIIFFMGGTGSLPSLIGSMLGSIGIFTLTPVLLFIIMGEVIFLSGMARKAIEVRGLAIGLLLPGTTHGDRCAGQRKPEVIHSLHHQAGRSSRLAADAGHCQRERVEEE